MHHTSIPVNEVFYSDYASDVLTISPQAHHKYFPAVPQSFAEISRYTNWFLGFSSIEWPHRAFGLGWGIRPASFAISFMNFLDGKLLELVVSNPPDLSRVKERRKFVRVLEEFEGTPFSTGRQDTNFWFFSYRNFLSNLGFKIPSGNPDQFYQVSEGSKITEDTAMSRS